MTFLREPTFYLGARGIVVYIEGKPLIKLRNSTYGTVHLNPGTYEVRVGEYYPGVGTFPGFAPTTRRLVLRSGGKYYLLLELAIIDDGRDAGRNAFYARAISNDRAEQLMKQFTRITKNPSG